MAKTYDCTSGGAEWCQGCYTMTEAKDGDGDYVRATDYQDMASAACLSQITVEAQKVRIAELESVLRKVPLLMIGTTANEVRQVLVNSSFVPQRECDCRDAFGRHLPECPVGAAKFADGMKSLPQRGLDSQAAKGAQHG